MAIHVTPLSDALGTEISGLDLRRELDWTTFGEIKLAWYEDLVLLFRDQELSEEDQVRFAWLIRAFCRSRRSAHCTTSRESVSA
jgi:taurine dioxygenase